MTVDYKKFDDIFNVTIYEFNPKLNMDTFWSIIKNWRDFRKDYKKWLKDPKRHHPTTRRRRVFDIVRATTISTLLSKGKDFRYQRNPKVHVAFAEIAPKQYLADYLSYNKIASLTAIRVALSLLNTPKDSAEFLLFDFQKRGGKFIK